MNPPFEHGEPEDEARSAEMRKDRLKFRLREVQVKPPLG